MYDLKHWTPGDLDLKVFSAATTESQKLELQAAAHKIIFERRINHAIQLTRLLGKWTNFLPLDKCTLDDASQTLKKPTRGLHWDAEDGLLYIVDLSKKIKVPFCWMDGCKLSCEANGLLLCSDHHIKHVEFEKTLDHWDFATPSAAVNEGSTEKTEESVVFEWGVPKAAQIRNKIEDTFSILLNKVNKINHPHSEKCLYVRDDFNQKLSNAVALHLINNGSVNIIGVKIGYSIPWDIFIFKLSPIENWQKKCIDTMCFLPAYTNSLKCEIHRYNKEWKMIAINAIMKLVGVSKWNELTETMIETAYQNLASKGMELYEDPDEGFDIAFEVSGDILLNRKGKTYKLCHGYENGCQNFIITNESCKSCNEVTFYVPFVLRHSDGKHFYVSKVIWRYAEPESRWKSRAKRQLTPILARFNKENTLQWKDDFIPISAGDFNLIDIPYSQEGCCFKGALVYSAGLALYIAYEAALLNKEMIFVNNRLYVAPGANVFQGFHMLLHSAGLKMETIWRNFKKQAKKEDQKTLLQFDFELEEVGYTPRTYNVMNDVTKLVYIGLYNPSSYEERVAENNIAPVRYKIQNTTRLLLGTDKDIEELPIGIVTEAGKPHEVETICILAAKFGSEWLMNGLKVVNNWLERMPTPNLNYFDELRNTTFYISGKTFEIIDEGNFKPLVWKGN